MSQEIPKPSIRKLSLGITSLKVLSKFVGWEWGCRVVSYSAWRTIEYVIFARQKFPLYNFLSNFNIFLWYCIECRLTLSTYQWTDWLFPFSLDISVFDDQIKYRTKTWVPNYPDGIPVWRPRTNLHIRCIESPVIIWQIMQIFLMKDNSIRTPTLKKIQTWKLQCGDYHKIIKTVKIRKGEYRIGQAASQYGGRTPRPGTDPDALGSFGVRLGHNPPGRGSPE